MSKLILLLSIFIVFAISVSSGKECSSHWDCPEACYLNKKIPTCGSWLDWKDRHFPSEGVGVDMPEGVAVDIPEGHPRRPLPEGFHLPLPEGLHLPPPEGLHLPPPEGLHLPLPEGIAVDMPEGVAVDMPEELETQGFIDHGFVISASNYSASGEGSGEAASEERSGEAASEEGSGKKEETVELFKTVTEEGSDTHKGSCQNGNGEDYSGSVNTTITGHSCRKWSTQSDPKLSSVGDHNYCRNPDGESGVWCFTTNKGEVWELCDVPDCSNAHSKYNMRNMSRGRKRFGYEFLYEKNPSVGEYFMEAFYWMTDAMNTATTWKYILPEDTDIDQDGNLSDLEVQHKFNTYMGEVFKLIDQDKDNSITEEEFRSLKLDIPHLTKVVDIALENFPLKPFFLAADGNGDGVYDENDFYMPELDPPRSTRMRLMTNVSINEDGLVQLEHYGSVVKIGQNEGTVICKSLGFVGLERVLELSGEAYYPVAYSCDGTEKRLEDCQEIVVNGMGWGEMGVRCRGPNKYDILRLVGGKDSSAGDIFVGNSGLSCVDRHSRRNTFNVVCRELGHSGVLRMTTRSAFTGDWESNKIRKTFKCTGDEEKLADCSFYSFDYCEWDWVVPHWVHGVVCATNGRTGMNEGLSDLIQWENNYKIWEDFGGYLFIADANGDGKLTLEELATKGKELMTKILEFLDQNQDGKISLEDINLHLSLRPIQNLVLELFDDVTTGQGELDLYNIKIAGQVMSKLFGFRIFDNNRGGLRIFDNNRDEKLNAADIFFHDIFLDGFHDIFPTESEVSFLIPLLSEKLDKNQDGKIQREELRQFIDDMFNQHDMDKNGALTLEDAYILLRENGLNCLQVGALRSFIKVFLDKIDTATRNIFGYIFHQFDIDGNGQISTTELEKMHVPCDPHKNSDYGYIPSYFGPGHFRHDDDSDPNARKGCQKMIQTYFWNEIGPMVNYFPKFVFSERQGRGRGEHGRGGHDEPQKETLVDKLTQHACQVLS